MKFDNEDVNSESIVTLNNEATNSFSLNQTIR